MAQAYNNESSSSYCIIYYDTGSWPTKEGEQNRRKKKTKKKKEMTMMMSMLMMSTVGIMTEIQRSVMSFYISTGQFETKSYGCRSRGDVGYIIPPPPKKN